MSKSIHLVLIRSIKNIKNRKLTCIETIIIGVVKETFLQDRCSKVIGHVVLVELK